jgi:glycosyltransferase involved in cell wall biosynthesis
MDVSIAMCTYNGSRFLGAQLASIAEQTRLPSELVVCDDGSTDSTPEILKAFVDRAPFPVRLIRNEVTLGSTKNFEKAVRLCTGDAIALCDQDDVWQRHKLNWMSQVLKCEPDVGGVFSDALLIDDESKAVAGSLWERVQFTSQMRADLNGKRGALLLLERRAVTGATLLFRSRFVPQVTPIPSEWVHDAWIALLVATQSRLRAMPEPLMSYRLHPGQQVGLRPRRWHSGLQVERATAMAAHNLAVRRWESLTAKLSTMAVEPRVALLAQQRLKFLQARTALRQRSVVERVIGATLSLPAYFKFSKGLLSFGRDVAGS